MTRLEVRWEAVALDPRQATTDLAVRTLQTASPEELSAFLLAVERHPRLRIRQTTTHHTPVYDPAGRVVDTIPVRHVTVICDR